MSHSTSLSDFKIQGKLGSGNFGNVFLCSKAERPHFPFAMKMISLNETTEKEKESLVRECHILNGLMHPNIVLYYESFIDVKHEEEYLCIVMEYCNGGSLFDVVKLLKNENKYVPEKILWKWFIQMIYALKYVHHKRIIHRDIKPMNLLLSTPHIQNVHNQDTSDTNFPNRFEKLTLSQIYNCDMKLADFGVSKLLESSNSMANTIIGTPLYLSPESINGDKYDSKVDIWAVGCCMYELMQHTHPFESNSAGALIRKIIEGDYPRINSNIYSDDFVQIIYKCLSHNPDSRLSCEEILNLDAVKEMAKELEIAFDNSYDSINIDAGTITIQKRPTWKQPQVYPIRNSTSQKRKSDHNESPKVYSHCIPPRPVASKKMNVDKISRVRRPPSSISQRSSPSIIRRGLSLRSNGRISSIRKREIEKVQNLPDNVLEQIKVDDSKEDVSTGIIELHVKQPELFSLLSSQNSQNGTNVVDQVLDQGEDQVDKDVNIIEDGTDVYREDDTIEPTWKILDEKENNTDQIIKQVEKTIQIEDDISKQIGEQLLQEFIQFFVENPSLSEEKLVQFAFGKISYTHAAVVPSCKELVEFRTVPVLLQRIQYLEEHILKTIPEYHYREILSFFLQKQHPTDSDIHRFVFGRISFEHVDVLHMIRQVAWMHKEIQYKSVLCE